MYNSNDDYDDVLFMSLSSGTFGGCGLSVFWVNRKNIKKGNKTTTKFEGTFLFCCGEM